MGKQLIVDSTAGTRRVAWVTRHPRAVLLAGVAGLTAGAFAMAAGVPEARTVRAPSAARIAPPLIARAVASGLSTIFADGGAWN